MTGSHKNKIFMILNSNTRSKGSGKLGDAVYYVLNGKQVVREYVGSGAIRDAKTELQMQQRTKWANIVSVYRSFGSALKGGFENKPAGWTDYTAFMSINLLQPGVYLTKQQAKMRATVAAPYVITQGSLDSIRVENGATDISVSSLTVDGTTTIAALAEAVVTGNGGRFCYNDQLTCFVVEQLVDDETERPYVRTSYLKVVLSPTDKRTLQSVVGDCLGFSVSDGHLVLGGTVDGAYTWVHSRKSTNGLYVSTQKLVCTNPIYDGYTQADTRALAGSSYGAKGGVVLNPGTNASDGNGTGTSGTGTSGSGTGTGGGSTDNSGGSDSGGGSEDGGDSMD